MIERGIGHIPIVEDRATCRHRHADRSHAGAGTLLGRSRPPRVLGRRCRDHGEGHRGKSPQLLRQLVANGNRPRGRDAGLSPTSRTRRRGGSFRSAEARFGPPPRALSLACLRIAGAAGTGRRVRPGQLPHALDDVTDAEICFLFALPPPPPSAAPPPPPPLSLPCPRRPRWAPRPPLAPALPASPLGWSAGPPKRRWSPWWMSCPRPAAEGEILLTAPAQAPETLQRASKNSIFTAHMIANSLKHTPAARSAARPRDHPLRRTPQPDRPEDERCRARRRPRPHLRRCRVELKPVNTARSRLEAAKAAGINVHHRGSRPSRRLRPDRDHASRTPGRSGEIRRKARQLPRSIRGCPTSSGATCAMPSSL